MAKNKEVRLEYYAPRSNGNHTTFLLKDLEDCDAVGELVLFSGNGRVEPGTSGHLYIWDTDARQGFNAPHQPRGGNRRPSVPNLAPKGNKGVDELKAMLKEVK